jgi:hypothetical protein
MKHICQLTKRLGLNFFEHFELTLRNEREFLAEGLGQKVVVSGKLFDGGLVRELGVFGKLEVPVF